MLLREKNFKIVFKKAALINMVRYLIIAVLCLIGMITAYMTGCTDVYFEAGERNVDCNSFGVTFNSGECHFVDWVPESSGGIDPPTGGEGGPKGFPPGTREQPTDPTGRRTGEPESPGYFKYEYSVTVGKIDLVFVIDNSSSMHKEHKNLESQAERFFNRIKNLPYRVAIITTDISSPGNHVKGAPYQDGNFIPFALSGRKFLENKNVGHPPSSEDVEDFKQTLVRPETIECDEGTSGKEREETHFWKTGEKLDTDSNTSGNSCPYHDERAIYAMNLAIEKQKDFFDPEAHLMFVIVSDEDERSSEEYIEEAAKRGENYEFESRDYPETLVETVYNYLGGMQTFSVHSIIIPPGDSGCLAKQNQGAYKGPGTGRGYYGVQYARLSEASDPELRAKGNLLRGSLIAICDYRFERQLAQVQIFTEVPRIPIPCDNPQKVFFKVNGKSTDLNYDLNERSLELEEDLPIGSRLTVRAYCPAPQS